MKCLIVIWIALQAIICCCAHVHPVGPSAYHPVFEYDVPVASQQIVYAAPGINTGQYYGSYDVHTTPAVSHTFSQTQTHPIAYVKPVTFGASSSGQYYGPAAATSRVEHSRLIVPQTNRIYRYQSVPQHADDNRGSNRKFTDERRQDQQYYSQASGPTQYNSQGEYSQNARDRNNRNPYKSNGEQVKLRRYQIHRPGIKKEFYDVEERVIVRPAGSALIELDPPSKKQDITNYHSGNYAPSNRQAFSTNNQYDSSKVNNPNEQYFSTGSPDCGGYFEQTPIYEQQPVYGETDTQYHPTTFAPTTTSSTPYPTTVYSTTPSQTYLPPYSPDHSTSPTQSTLSPEYIPSTTYSSTPTTTTASTSTSTAAKQSDVFISSTTPVSVIIVDKSTDANQRNNSGQDIIYAGQGQSAENPPDQFQNELPPRGDISQYQAADDQFYHELPRSRFSNDPSRPPQTFNVYSRSNGEPTESPYSREAEVVEIGRNNSQNQTSTGNDQQSRLIALYTGGDGISEVGQTTDRKSSQYVADGNRYNNNENERNDIGKVRARVVSVTPPPATAIPTETVNRRRIVVSKPVTTIQEVVEPENSTSSQNGRYQTNNGYYHQVENNYNQNSNYQTDQNGDTQTKKANYENTSGSSGIYISATTPTTASERIIYVQPVSQDFAKQKAVAPKQN